MIVSDYISPNDPLFFFQSNVPVAHFGVGNICNCKFLHFQKKPVLGRQSNRFHKYDSGHEKNKQADRKKRSQNKLCDLPAVQ